MAIVFPSVKWSWLLAVLDRQAFPERILNVVRGLLYATEPLISPAASEHRLRSPSGAGLSAAVFELIALPSLYLYADLSYVVG